MLRQVPGELRMSENVRKHCQHKPPPAVAEIGKVVCVLRGLLVRDREVVSTEADASALLILLFSSFMAGR